jgi:7,8-dihydro-6-hydroxymethylpterin dimethyltransferase
VRDRGMRPTLMTNGKKATRALLAELVAAGLVDVAFHVDTTQQRKGHATEEALNAVRIRYMERARGLGLSVMFNTTVHRGNFHEIPMLAAFFRRHAREVRTVSFQLQADTGRGVLGARDSVISPETVAACIQEGAGVALNFNASRVGHPGCNRYAMGLEVNGRLYNLFDDPQALGRLQQATAGLILDRRRPMRVLVAVASWLFRHPRFAMPVARLGIRKLLEMSSDLFAARGQVHTLSFLIHNFMDACALDRERIEACVFKTMTRDGPMSMCLHNARRDEFILQPVPMNPAQGLGYWQPLTGEMGDEETAPLELDPDRYAFKRLKGRARVRFQRDPSRGSGRRLAG